MFSGRDAPRQPEEPRRSSGPCSVRSTSLRTSAPATSQSPRGEQRPCWGAPAVRPTPSAGRAPWGRGPPRRAPQPAVPAATVGTTRRARPPAPRPRSAGSLLGRSRRAVSNAARTVIPAWAGARVIQRSRTDGPPARPTCRRIGSVRRPAARPVASAAPEIAGAAIAGALEPAQGGPAPGTPVPTPDRTLPVATAAWTTAAGAC